VTPPSTFPMHTLSLHVTRATSVGAAVILALVAAPAQTPPQAQTARELTLTVGKSLVVNSAANIERVAVGFGDVAEARAVGPREVLLDGKAPGETSLIVWQEGGNKLFFDVIVRPNATPARMKLEGLRRRIDEEIQQPVDVSIEGDNVFLRGTVKDLTSAQRAVAIGSTAGKVTNLLYVNVPPTDAQVLLKVRFASLDRSVTHELGMNLFSTGATNTIGRVSTGQFSPPASQQVGGTSPANFSLSDALNIFLFRRDINLGATIKALETRGLVEILAEPNVLAINGKQASFVAGGEFPYPILQGGGGGVGTVTVAFREFGVRINFLPILTPRGTIRLDVAPEVSSLDYANGLSVQGFNVPGLATRRVETEVELEPGQSFAIGGLLDRRLTQTIDKMPLLADIPLLGKLFRSRSLTKANNELLVIITPEIVRPVAADKAQHLSFPEPLPGDDKAAPGTAGASEAGSAPAVQQERMPVEQLLQQLKTESEMNLKKGSTVATWPGSQPYPAPTQMQTPETAQPPAAPPPATPAAPVKK
jgi:pilus assembly protein CpaC